MPKTKEAPAPRSMLLTAEQIKPTLGEAFERWQELGEWPKDAILARFVGSSDARKWPNVAYHDEVSGEIIYPDETWETLCVVRVAKNKKDEWHILRKPA